LTINYNTEDHFICSINFHFISILYIIQIFSLLLLKLLKMLFGAYTIVLLLFKFCFFSTSWILLQPNFILLFLCVCMKC